MMSGIMTQLWNDIIGGKWCLQITSFAIEMKIKKIKFEKSASVCSKINR